MIQFLAFGGSNRPGLPRLAEENRSKIGLEPDRMDGRLQRGVHGWVGGEGIFKIIGKSEGEFLRGPVNQPVRFTGTPGAGGHGKQDRERWKED